MIGSIQPRSWSGSQRWFDPCHGDICRVSRGKRPTAAYGSRRWWHLVCETYNPVLIDGANQGVCSSMNEKINKLNFLEGVCLNLVFLSKASVNLINLSTVQAIGDIPLQIGCYSEENVKLSGCSYTLNDWWSWCNCNEWSKYSLNYQSIGSTDVVSMKIIH